MFQFNTAFLLKAIALTALGCLPMAYNKDTGFVWSAFIVPFSLAWLVATRVEQRGQLEFQFNEKSNSVVDVSAAGGRYEQWLTRCRMVAFGACVSAALGFPLLNLVDPEPIAIWLPLVVLFVVVVIVIVSQSTRLSVLTEQRQFVTDYLLFGRLRWWRRRWQVRDGDFLQVHAIGQSGFRGLPEMQFRQTLYVRRARRRHMITALFAGERDASGIELAAQRIARLVGIPSAGYSES